jgi:hypothetical protein
LTGNVKKGDSGAIWDLYGASRLNIYMEKVSRAKTATNSNKAVF